MTQAVATTQAAAARAASPALRHLLVTLAYLLVIVGVWHLYVTLADVPVYLLPAPDAVWQSLVTMSEQGLLWGNVLYTVRNILIGFVGGIVIGMVLGYVLWASRWAREIAAPYIVVLQAAPKIAIAPLLVLWFGLGFESQLVLILMLSFFPMMVSMRLGLESISSDVETLGRLLGMSRWRYFRTVQLPGSMPELMSGAKIAIIDAMTGAFLAEYISAQVGLGYLMVLGNSSYNTPMLIAAVLLTVLAGLAGFGAIGLLEKRLLRWRRSH
ncbi:ABC transporter permease [Salinibacterium sp. dk2585]|uniref:ABC transporter permease n=1 Tax=unclassified Salinibacterium TaxID=2632331 RepID=UPI0011C2572B|nr:MULTISPECIES: ABC transporter permease [unclassified Salinibacterium]QEE62390.1 ABC transporter permease [Salinibacterium sp. dk2585]TXK52727.1 ABC transporter permease [Salinibacterium sp. dk5596]